MNEYYVEIGADEDIVSIVAAHPAGTTFYLKPGLHVVKEAIVAKEGDRFIGSEGSSILCGWETEWFAKG